MLPIGAQSFVVQQTFYAFAGQIPQSLRTGFADFKAGQAREPARGLHVLRRRQANRLRLRRHTGGQQIIYHRGLGRVGKKVRRRMRHHAADIGQAGERRLGRGAHIGQRAESLRQYFGGALAHMADAQRKEKARQLGLFARFDAGQNVFGPFAGRCFFQAV